VFVIVDDERSNPLEAGGNMSDTRRPASRRAIAGLSLGNSVAADACDRLCHVVVWAS